MGTWAWLMTPEMAWGLTRRWPVLAYWRSVCWRLVSTSVGDLKSNASRLTPEPCGGRAENGSGCLGVFLEVCACQAQTRPCDSNCRGPCETSCGFKTSVSSRL
jgi:hypothetical protein